MACQTVSDGVSGQCYYRSLLGTDLYFSHYPDLDLTSYLGDLDLTYYLGQKYGSRHDCFLISQKAQTLVDKL